VLVATEVVVKDMRSLTLLPFADCRNGELCRFEKLEEVEPPMPCKTSKEIVPPLEEQNHPSRDTTR
jgi:hypothetical protein